MNRLPFPPFRSAMGQLLRWLPAFFWAATIFGASTDVMSAAHTSRYIEPFLRWLVPGISNGYVGLVHMVIRKGGHLTEYAIFGILLRSAMAGGGRPSWKGTVAAFALSAIYAASDEFHQSFVPSRQASVDDVLIDMCGAALGLAMVMAASSLAERLARTREGEAA